MSDYKQTRDAAGNVTSQYGQMLRDLDDDLVERARHNALADMPHYASVDLIEAMADRIEELEAKLAKAVRLIQFLDKEYQHVWGVTAKSEVRTTLAELKGETD